MLVGSEPQALAADLRVPDTLPPPPDALAIGEPISLLRRRPDVAATEYAVLAAAARAGVAAAELFPRLVLTGGVGLQAVSVGDANNRGLRFGLGVGVTLPLFEWNRIRQRILAADATAEVALADYEGTALVRARGSRARDHRLRAGAGALPSSGTVGAVGARGRRSRPAAIPVRRGQLSDACSTRSACVWMRRIDWCRAASRPRARRR